MEEIKVVRKKKWHFTKVENEIIDTDKLSIYEKMVYITLARHSDLNDFTSYPSIKTIALKVGCSDRKVSSVIKELVSKGLIDVKHKVNSVSTYTLLEIPKEFKISGEYDSVGSECDSLGGERHSLGGERGADELESINNKQITKNKRPKFSTSDFQLAELLYYCIKQNNPTHKKPNLESWADTFRLMRERDGRKHEQIEACIKWCQSDSFWYKNILSADKLREKYDQLNIQAASKRNKGLNVKQQQLISLTPAPQKVFDPSTLFD